MAQKTQRHPQVEAAKWTAAGAFCAALIAAIAAVIVGIPWRSGSATDAPAAPSASPSAPSAPVAPSASLAPECAPTASDRATGRGISIRLPKDGGAVGDDERICGVGAVAGSYYYPLVTPALTHQPYIGGSKISVSDDGSWSGLARFGDTNTASGAVFTLEIVGSARELAQGPIDVERVRLARSKPVDVTRR